MCQVGTYDERLMMANGNYNIEFLYFFYTLLPSCSSIAQQLVCGYDRGWSEKASNICVELPLKTEKASAMQSGTRGKILETRELTS